MNALMLAVESKAFGAIDELLQRKANVDHKNKVCPISTRAAHKLNAEWLLSSRPMLCVKKLSSSNPHSELQAGNTALMLAAKSNYTTALKNLLKTIPKINAENNVLLSCARNLFLDTQCENLTGIFAGWPDSNNVGSTKKSTWRIKTIVCKWRRSDRFRKQGIFFS